MMDRSRFSIVLLVVGLLLLGGGIVAAVVWVNSSVIGIGLLLSSIGYLVLPVTRWYTYMVRISVILAGTTLVIREFGAPRWITKPVWDVAVSTASPLLMLAGVALLISRILPLLTKERR